MAECKKLPLVTCRICHKKDIDRNPLTENIDWICTAKNYYYHKTCFDEWGKKKVDINAVEADDFYYSSLLDYLAKDIKLPVNYSKVCTQWQNLLAKGYKPKGIYFTIKYYYDVTHGDLDKADGGIGIVSYIYKEATNYWVQQEERNKGLMEGILKQLTERANRAELKIYKSPAKVCTKKFEVEQDDT